MPPIALREPERKVCQIVHVPAGFKSDVWKHFSFPRLKRWERTKGGGQTKTTCRRCWTDTHRLHLCCTYCRVSVQYVKSSILKKNPLIIANCTFFQVFIWKKIYNKYRAVNLIAWYNCNVRFWCHYVPTSNELSLVARQGLSGRYPQRNGTCINTQKFPSRIPLEFPEINTRRSRAWRLYGLGSVNSGDMEHVHPPCSQGQLQQSKLCCGRPCHQTSVFFNSPRIPAWPASPFPCFGPEAKQNTGKSYGSNSEGYVIQRLLIARQTDT